MYQAERVRHLDRLPPAAVDQLTLLRLLGGRTASSRVLEMAAAVYFRYCTPSSAGYPEIGRRLGISAEHARRLADRALRMLSEDLYGRTDIEGTKLWEAIKRRPPRRRRRSSSRRR